MRWISFVIVLYVATVTQTAVMPVLALHGVRPDVLVILAVHCGLSARKDDALLACWLTGLAIDLAGLGYAQHAGIGVSSLAMGLIGLLLVALRGLTFRESVVTQIAFTFLVGFLNAGMCGLYARYAASNPPGMAAVIQGSVLGAAYSALVSPYVHWLLRKLRGFLGLGTSDRIRVR